MQNQLDAPRKSGWNQWTTLWACSVFLLGCSGTHRDGPDDGDKRDACTEHCGVILDAGDDLTPEDATTPTPTNDAATDAAAETADGAVDPADAAPLEEPPAPREGWVELGLGDDFSCARRAEGTIWCWGVNWLSALGVSSTWLEYSVQPRQIGITSDFVELSVSENHGCARKTDGSVWCWGEWKWREGGGYPTQILDPGDWTDISALSRELLVLKSDGTLWNVPSYDLPEIFRVDEASDWSTAPVGEKACGLKRDGTLWCREGGKAVTLSDGSTTSIPQFKQVGTDTDWREVSGSNSDTSGWQLCARKRSGSLWCWGLNREGQVGDGTTERRFDPVRVGNAADWVGVSVSEAATCGRRLDGSAWCWGWNAVGQLGDGTTEHRHTPSRVASTRAFDLLATGGGHTCGRTRDGAIWCWGFNQAGQLGIDFYALSPQQVGEDDDWKSVITGANNTCGVKEDNTLWCWGYVPMGGRAVVSRFVYAPTQYWPESAWSASALASSALHVCGAKLDGSLWCWGSNSSGELAQGDLWSSEVPLQVGSDGGWTRVMTGWEHTCARKQTPGSSESALWCWGHNYYGQASSSDEDEIREPNKVAGSELWRAESAGSFFNCAITDGRSIVCWGKNDKGQLGDGTTTARAEPAPIASEFQDWVSLSAGGDNACAIRADGSLWCWGANEAGQIGDGTGTTRLSPVRVGTASNWTHVEVSRLTYPATNYEFVRETPATCALNKLGELWCWGANPMGRLGDGTFTSHFTPEPVDSARDWSAVVLGARHACALKRDHTLWCWGVDYHGQLGDAAQARPRRALDP